MKEEKNPMSPIQMAILYTVFFYEHVIFLYIF